MDTLTPQIIAALAAVAFIAGFIDAIAGGGGLITVPALALAGLSPVQAVATNKLQASFGSGAAALTFYRAGHLRLGPVWPGLVLAALGSAIGASALTYAPRDAMRVALPIVIGAVALYFALSPRLSDAASRPRLKRPAFVATVVPLVGFYDGVFGPGAGSFYMLGAYLALTLTEVTGDVFLATALGIPLAVAFGAAIEWAFVRHLYARDHLQQVLLTFALILIFNELQRIVWGSYPHGVPAPSYLAGSVKLTEGLTYPVYRLALTAICAALAGGMFFVIQKTRVGRLIRAGESNREMTELLGFDASRLYRLVFAAGTALAALAGMLAAPVESVYPGIGERVLIISFVVVVIGGIGSIRGAFLGALAIGVADALGKVFLPNLAGVVVYALMAAVLVVRPGGLFGRMVR